MKKLFAGIILALAAVAAIASPRPSEIESALAAHDIQSAKSMTQEVLREHPDSAKAHLFNAYVLAKEGNTVAASEELKNVNRLDKQRDPGRAVRNSALYGRTVAELERATPQRGGYVIKTEPKTTRYAPLDTYQPVVQKQESSALLSIIKWMFYLTIIGLIIWAILAFLKSRPRPVQAPATFTTQSWTDTPVETSYTNHGRSYEAPPHAMYGSGRGTVVSAPVAPVAPVTIVNNGGNHSDGLLTGMMLNEAMHGGHHHHHSRDYDDYGSTRVVEREYVAPAPAWTSAPAYEAPRSTDYETSRSSYSSGGDDDWKSSSSSSSSDSWSSSDSGSSSSDSGGGGGWD